MMNIRKSTERGRAAFGWLESRHTFSFGEYYDPNHLGFRSLRVINDDQVRGGAGFSEHPHSDMEIISYVLDGSLAHRDSMGNGSVLSAGDVQVITAGTGVRHSEMNPSLEEPVHFLQIWIVPERRGLEPSYREQSFSVEEKQRQLAHIVSGSGAEGALEIHQDVELFASVLAAGEGVDYSLESGRHAWIQVARGKVAVNGENLEVGDGAAITDEVALRIEGQEASEFLLFDLH